MGSVDRVNEALAHLQRAFGMQGLAINLSKCTLWGPGADAVMDLPQGSILRGIPVTPYDLYSGLKVFGVPVGRPGERGIHEAIWLKKVAELRKACTDLIGVPDPQIQHCLLRQCLDAAKV